MKSLKKLISFAVSVTIAAGMLPVSAETDSIEFLYSYPNTELKSGRNYIGVNQEEIKLVFDKAVSKELLQGITFSASDNSVPVGGVVKTIDEENTVLLKFGELDENKTYTIHIPEIKDIIYRTVKKLLVSENFDDWTLGDITPTATGYFSFEQNPDMKGRRESENITFSVEGDDTDKYIVTNVSEMKKDMMLGTQLPEEMVDVEVVSFMKYKNVSTGTGTIAEIGSCWGYQFNGVTFNANQFEKLSGFSKDEKGFYNIKTITKKYNTEADGAYTLDRYAEDLISGTAVSSTKNGKAGITDSKIYTTAAIKSYVTDEKGLPEKFALTDYRAGFFTTPRILTEPELSGKNMSFYMNTDMNTDMLSDIKITNNTDNCDVVLSDIKYNNRNITLKTDTALYGKDYTISFGNMTSVDGMTAEDYTAKNVKVFPNTEIKGNYIGVNQGEVKFVLKDDATDGLAKSITMSDSLGNEPVGGIHTSCNGNEIVVEFGELKENESYTLELPGYKRVTYSTVDKTIIDEDFEGWDIGDVTPDDTGYFSFTQNPKLKGRRESENITFSIEGDNADKYMVTKVGELNKDMMLGAALPQEMTDANIISFVQYKDISVHHNSIAQIGSAWVWHLGGSGIFTGNTFSDLYDFDKNENGFYEVYTKVRKYDTDITGDYNFESYARDLISGRERKSIKTDNYNATNNKIDSISAVKSYVTNASHLPETFALTDYRAGFYTEPRVLSEPTALGNTLTFYMNTDIHSDNLSEISIRNANTGVETGISDIDYDNRRVTVVLAEELPKDYVIDFGDIKSVDGLDIEEYRTNITLNELIEQNGEISLYISPNGNDLNTGFEETAPIKTIDEVMNLIDILKNSSFNGILNVNFLPGVYRIDDTLKLSDISFELNLLGREGAQLTTAEQISREEFYAPSADIENRLPLSAKGKVKAADITKYIPQKYMYLLSNSKYKTFCIYDGGEEKQLSSYPDEDYFVISADDLTKTETGYDIKLDAAKRWGNRTVFAEGYLAWMFSYYKIPGVKSSAEGSIYIPITDIPKDEGSTWITIKDKDRLAVKNVLEENNLKGDWTVEDGILYYYGDSFDDVEISYVWGNMIEISNSDNVKFSGLTFKNIADNAIFVKMSDNLVIEDCRFINIGKGAVIGREAGKENKPINNLLIKNNYFENLGYLGINIAGGDVHEITPSGNVITKNVFNGISTNAKTYAQAVCVAGIGNEVSYNTFRNCDHTCIGFKGSLNKIIGNYITESCRNSGDIGAIYAGRNMAWVRNEIAYNYIENALITDEYIANDDTRSTFQTGIYTDDRLGGTLIHHNYIKNAARGIFHGGGSNTQIYDNVTENCKVGISISAVQVREWETDTVTQNAVVFCEEHPKYLEEFPWLSNIVTEEIYKYYPHNNLMKDNIDVGSIESYAIGLSHGLNEGEQMNQFEAGDFAETLVMDDIKEALAAKGIDLSEYNYSCEDNSVELIKPENEDFNQSLSEIEFMWKAVYGANEYALKIYDGNNNLLKEVKTRKTHAEVTDLPEKDSYLWEVVAYTKSGEITSEKFSFKTMPAAVYSVTMMNENNEAVKTLSEAEYLVLNSKGDFTGEIIIGVYSNGILKSVTGCTTEEKITIPQMQIEDELSVYLWESKDSMIPKAQKIYALKK